MFVDAVFAQKTADSLARQAYLPDCIQYALGHQPIVRQSVIDQEIAERTVQSALAAWYPQIARRLQPIHYLKLPVTIFPDPNNWEKPSPGQLARKTRRRLRSRSPKAFSTGICCWPAVPPTLIAPRLARTTVRNKIDVVVNVSKAFYDVILTQRQVDILAEDIVRLQRSLQDATNQYQGGIVDKTDPQRAHIALNNTRAQQKQYRDLVGCQSSRR